MNTKVAMAIDKIAAEKSYRTIESEFSGNRVKLTPEIRRSLMEHHKKNSWKEPTIVASALGLEGGLLGGLVGRSLDRPVKGPILGALAGLGLGTALGLVRNAVQKHQIMKNEEGTLVPDTSVLY